MRLCALDEFIVRRDEIVAMRRFGTRQVHGVQFAETHASSITGMVIRVRSREMTFP